ncbi:metacaspase-1-like [Durio zibethinus]|uniref:Metacaspase-1-like n=1 Tax=Durio zibethinus TaxID=66656 RepID=A0A6P6AC73_DURZI|nr:metacaspase-1-like [Durio zibethinus]XP_022762413.1 metacaspase-1-like [Durio zibethinus]
MEVGRTIPCSRCRQRLVVKTTTKDAGVVCPLCCNVLPIPNEGQTNQSQGLRSRIRTFGSHMKSKMHHSTVTPPSLNYQPASGPNPITSSKRAVLCGITYNNWKRYKLKGTVNDVRNMRDLLITRFGYPRECIRVLTEEETDQRFIPTRKNIEDSLRWLVNDECQSGDSLVFFFSGHGLRQPDFNNDELDGFDETICPVDFRKAGLIVDNDLNSLIVRPLRKGVTLHAIVDACHSGTILDLPNVYCSLEKKWKDNSPPSGVDKRANGGLAISISACLDDQAAADTSAFNGEMNGALTYLLAEVLKKLPGPTYGDLFDLIHETFDNVNQGCLVNTRILRRIFGNRLSQTPLLSSSDKFDVYKRHLFL